MKARNLFFTGFGGVERLRLIEEDVPAPGPGEARVRFRALALNRAEIMLRQGLYPVDEAPDFPSRLGMEAAGIVESVGAGVAAVRSGDAVTVFPLRRVAADGIHGELRNLPAEALGRIPAGLSFAQAAALPIQYVTAYGALVWKGGLREGQTLLVNAASSSVGLAAIQVANRTGARPIAITRTRAKAAELVAAGADRVLVSDEVDVPAAVRALTRGEGAQLALDSLGGEALGALAGGMARFGRIIHIGFMARAPVSLPVSIITRGISIEGFSYFHVAADPGRRRAAIDYLLSGLASGALDPVLDASDFSLDRIRDAHRHVESNAQFGKVVVSVDGGGAETVREGV